MAAPGDLPSPRSAQASSTSSGAGASRSAFDTLWLGLPLVLAETWALVMLALFVFEGWRRTERESHRCTARAHGRRSSIPTYNESEDVLRPTVLGARAVRAIPAPGGVGARRRREVMGRRHVRGARRALRLASGAAGPCEGRQPQPRTRASSTPTSSSWCDADQCRSRTRSSERSGTSTIRESPSSSHLRSSSTGASSIRASTGDPLLNEQSMFYDVICPGKGPQQRGVLVRQLRGHQA